MKKTFVGAHVSIAGGIEKSFDRAAEIGANCFQIFTDALSVPKILRN